MVHLIYEDSFPLNCKIISIIGNYVILEPLEAEFIYYKNTKLEKFITIKLSDLLPMQRLEILDEWEKCKK